MAPVEKAAYRISPFPGKAEAIATPPFARADSPWSIFDLDLIRLPPASRLREIVKLANNNLSNGYLLFAHYAQPTLEFRRNAVISSGTTKKKFYKSVGELWRDLPPYQKTFWNGEAALLRRDIKQKVISHEECVRCVGNPDQWDTYIQYAESAVAEYLCISLPILIPPRDSTQNYPKDSIQQTQYVDSHKEQVISTAPAKNSEVMSPRPSNNTEQLLDTLPDRFDVNPRMVYGHFARYDLDEILTTPTRKRQLEKLHQLADLFDETGRTLFYYYAYPRLWKRLRPLEVDESIAIFAQEIWRHAVGGVREQWRFAEVGLKKMLGDGDMDGLALLRLDGLNKEVWRLHGMAEEAVSGRLGGMDKGSGKLLLPSLLSPQAL